MKFLVFLHLLLLPLSAREAPESVTSRVAALHTQAGGYKNGDDDPLPTLSATTMAMRTFRYLGIDLQNTASQKEFLLSRYRPAKAAFVENGADEPTVLANAFALMLMAELGMPEDVHAISARDFVVEHAASFDEIYMAMAGLGVMGLADEIPATWIKTMMDTAIGEESSVTPYDKARAIVTCMRTGFNLPDYSRFLAPLQKALSDIASAPDYDRDATALQHAYTIARALVMIDGRAELPVPDLSLLAADRPPVSRLYRVAALRAWEPKLRGQLKIAICTGFAPVGFRAASGTIAGMDADLMRAFAREHGYELVFEEHVKFDGIWKLPARGHVDAAVSGISKRRDRLTPGIRWSHPYFNVDRSLSILRSNADRFRTIADLGGMKIAVTTGTTGDRDVRERNPDAIRVPYDNEDEAIRDLLAGKVHALARGDVSNRYDARLHPELAVIDTHPMDPVEEFVVAADRVALGQKLDRFLREARRSGELDELFSKYLEEPPARELPEK